VEDNGQNSWPDRLVEALGRIESWLAQHAPRDRGLLNPPAGDDDLAHAENQIGISLPPEVDTWWRWADGATGRPYEPGPLLIPPGFVPYRIVDALQRRTDWMAVARNIAPDLDDLADLIRSSGHQPAGTSCYTWLPSWLPIATDRAGGDLFIDLRDGSDHGCVMRFYEEDGLALTLWPNLTGMASAIAGGLDGHTHVSNSHHSFNPHVENGRLTWRLAT